MFFGVHSGRAAVNSKNQMSGKYGTIGKMLDSFVESSHHTM
jgi:hypothetical protein